MAKQGLLYERPRPVAKSWHADWSVSNDGGFTYAAGLSAAPLAVIEFGVAARHHPIVFVEGEAGVSPLALLGLSDNENLSVDAEGKWIGGYIPAFIRRYPFVLAKDGDTDKFTLCIDEASQHCNSDGRGEKLFDGEGEPSTYLTRMLDLSRDWERSRQATQVFCDRLSELDLLVPQKVSIRDAAGNTSLAGGFSAVSRERLKGLSDEQLGTMMRSGHLEAVLAHLVSLGGLETLAGRISERRAG
ncbi:SapC family protein [Pseudooceanicola sp. LIPI14-2-Ac024]|uniref:SapC family protein n=1 Tax=Pseudooceanicola sp. LIPI14-2-Ac024 TaxID=3344875 RepID=UPI0035CEB935